jgi:retron-type reverse transcriptase
MIQKAIFTFILEKIYKNKEKIFLDTSHDFCLDRSCYTAFKQIQKKWTVIPWFVKIDIKDTFGITNRNILIFCFIRREELYDE